MIVYSNGDKVKVKRDSTSLGVDLKKSMVGIVVAAHPSRVEAAIEGLGLVSVGHDLIKKKVAKTERLVKAKNLKLSDEVSISGSGAYDKIASIYQNVYDSADSTITIETVSYDTKVYNYNELVEVRR